MIKALSQNGYSGCLNICGNVFVHIKQYQQLRLQQQHTQQGQQEQQQEQKQNNKTISDK
jgi:hypothetical protein